MRYYEFRYLVEGYPQAQAAFIQAGADTAAVQKTIADFKQLVTRNQVKDVNQKNIDWWVKQGWDKFNQFVKQAAAVPSKSQIEKKKLPGQSINLIDNANWLVLVPIDKDASCFHGKNSDWCTTKVHQGNFEHYFYENKITLIYCFNKSSGGMWAIAAHKKTDKMEMFDQKDNNLTAAEFQKQTGLDPNQLRGMAMGDVHQPKIQASRDKWNESFELTKKLLEDMFSNGSERRSSEIEKQLFYNKSGLLCCAYVRQLNPDERTSTPLAIQIAAVGFDGDTIRFFKNPSEKLQLIAVKQNSFSIKWIKFPSEKVQLAAVYLDEDNRGYIESWSAIQHIRNPSKAAQLLAVQCNRLAIKEIKNPDPEVKELADKMEREGIDYYDDREIARQ